MTVVFSVLILIVLASVVLLGLSVRVVREYRPADPRTMGLQYLEALKSLGSSAATTFVIPVELTGILQGMAGQAGRASGNGRGQT